MSKIELDSVGQTKEGTFEYDWKRIALYNLGIGAQAEDLSFVYERVQGGMKVFPSFATIVAGSGMLFPQGTDYVRLLHGEQLIRVYVPFKPSGTIKTKGVIEHIYDKGKGKAALIHTKVSGHSLEGEHIFDTKYVFFVAGSGGFGGDPGPKTEPINPPEGVEPDFSSSYQTSPNQAAYYRLNGDLNPLHIDPNFAKMARQPKPILHGLCTYGIATRAIVNELCDGDVSRFKEFSARFKDVVFPGETLTTEGWKDNGRYIIQLRTDRGPVVLGNAYAIVE
ncbi:MAG: MaoC family dehydratase N-terminal domain-containing protein [Candidatus Lokiarchaeota archaeon]|nr:MaoC family dehydratase N-terminal domain-containing protein [Candidatus Lokiarchaeota archaeon]